MNNLQKELQELKEKVADLETRIAAEPVAKWQPKGGNFFIQSNGKVSEVVGGSDTPHREFGVERPAREQAQRASVEMCRFNRLLALRDELCGELCGDDVDDLEENKETYFVFYSKQSNMWKKDYILNIKFETPLFTSHDSAQKACDMLNSGEVEL